MDNVPPQEMWIVENGTRTRYYRTLEQMQRWTENNRHRWDKIWYCNFNYPNPKWEEWRS